jgi:hypothetical protein
MKIIRIVNNIFFDFFIVRSILILFATIKIGGHSMRSGVQNIQTLGALSTPKAWREEPQRPSRPNITTIFGEFFTLVEKSFDPASDKRLLRVKYSVFNFFA